MTRQSRFIIALIGMAGLVISLGCTPQHPFYLGCEKPVPSTAVTASTKIEYPDTEVESLNEVNLAQSPYSLLTQVSVSTAKARDGLLPCIQ